MATIQGLEATIRASRAFPGKYWISGGASQGLDKEGEWTPLDCWTPHYHDDVPAAQAFIEQHADKPATPAAEVADPSGIPYPQLVAELRQLIEGFRMSNDDTKRFLHGKVATAEAEIDRLRTELAAARAENETLRVMQGARTVSLGKALARAEKAEAELESERAYAQGLREQLKGAGRE